MWKKRKARDVWAEIVATKNKLDDLAEEYEDLASPTCQWRPTTRTFELEAEEAKFDDLVKEYEDVAIEDDGYDDYDEDDDYDDDDIYVGS
ncbi:hypothetical protein KC338_g4526 [Hortaea werneckii]|nr:hypothetical protein KC323_g4096 [Hortaea werneckii]KAI6867157.1 hypothetical protein KC338_g4526 [Hortaea werneckii]